ncbi:MAG: polymer-forming cytoskeletal protein [Planctomycetota bacterium]|nr:MAG: polymer-forming cytoskeletal protein [Planctomycetota bacterium]
MKVNSRPTPATIEEGEAMATSNEITVIGPDTHIKGEMTFGSTARVLGTFEGTITAKGEVQVAEGATCRASIDAARVAVDGVVEGNVTAHEKLTLNQKARLKGDLVAPTLVVAEGAEFKGHVTVGGDATSANGRAPSAAEPKVVVPAADKAAAKK